MKIISKYKDFYDFCGYGIDENLIYTRTINNQIEWVDYMLPFKILTSNFMYNYRGENNQFMYELFIVAFCGKFYPLMKIIENLDYKKNKYNIRPLHLTFTNYTTSFIYDTDEIQKKFIDIKGDYAKNYIRDFTDVVGLENKDVFIDIQKPYFMIKVYYNNLNNNQVQIKSDFLLKDIHFQNVMDCHQVHQEISMFLPIINNMDNCINSSDIIKRDNHGFNDKSFKSTKPGDKKTRRKLNKKIKRNYG